MSKKITRASYLKAKRVVNAYEKQQQAGKYQFLYWLQGEENDEESVSEKWITAYNIQSACSKFLKLSSSDMVKVDYEVFFNGQYLDISEYEDFRSLI